MDYATLIPLLLKILQNTPELWQAVQAFWNAIHAHTAASVPHRDQVRQAIADARAKVAAAP